MVRASPMWFIDVHVDVMFMLMSLMFMLMSCVHVDVDCGHFYVTLSVSWLGVAIVQLAVASMTPCHLHLLLLDSTLAFG